MSRIVSVEDSGLVLSERGEWFYHGTPVEHPKVAAYFHRCIRKDERGRFYLRNQGGDVDECVYFRVEGTAYFIECLYFDEVEGAFRAALNTGAEVPLDLSRLSGDAQSVLYAKVLDDDRARFTRTALHHLARYLEEDEKGYHVPLTGQRLDIWP